MKNILLLVDAQNGLLNTEETKHLKSRLSDLVNNEKFDCVIATKFENEQHSPFKDFLYWFGMTGEKEIEMIPEIHSESLKIIDKDTYIVRDREYFIDTLVEAAEGCKPYKVFIAGVDTDGSVMYIANELFSYKIRPVVLQKYCASTGGIKYHDAAIMCMKRSFGEDQVYDGFINSFTDLSDI